MRSTSHTPALNLLAVLSVAAMLTACGGGGATGTGTDSTVSLATISTGHTPTPIGATPTTPVTTPVATTPVVPATIGAPLTDVRLQNTGSAQTNVPFTFGQVFAAGALSSTDGLAAKLADGTVLPLQMDVKTTNADGSVRHAIISGVLPVLAAGQTQTLNLVKSATAPKSTVTLQGLLSAGLTGKTTVTLNGVKYTASLAEAVAATTTPTTWLSGAIANEWIVSAPLKDANGVAHPQLNARFDVRWYSGLNKQARVEFVVENNKTWVPGAKLNYNVDLELAGSPVFSKTGMDHYHHSRWHQYFWWSAAQQPAVNVQLNSAYLIATKAVPNYDPTFAPRESELSSLAQTINSSNTGPMTVGPVTSYMPTTGGRNDIGSLPTWSVMWLFSMDKRARDVMMAAADGAATWSIHYRDEKTGRPLRTDNDTNKDITTHFNLRTRGPLPVPRYVNDDLGNSWSPYTDDTAHQPSLAYLPYLVTGDYYYLEELQFWAASNPLNTDPSGSGHGQGLLRWLQLRGQAWSLRTLGQTAYITPDADVMKPYFTNQLNANLDFYYQTYVVGNPNKLGAYDGSGEGAFNDADNFAPWQDDFLTWALGYVSELGFTKADPVLKWKAQYSVGRMTAPGFCWVAASSYILNIRPNRNSGLYGSFADVYKATYGGDQMYNDDINWVSANRDGKRFSDMSCGSQEQADFLGSVNGYQWSVGRMMGYADASMGYPANMQPALAVAVQSGATDAAKAWEIFMNRSAKPDYHSAPQWAILPR